MGSTGSHPPNECVDRAARSHAMHGPASSALAWQLGLYSKTMVLSSVQQFPLMTCESYTTMVADSAVKVSTLHCRLLQRLSRGDRTDCLVESRLFSSLRRSFPHDGRSPGLMARGRRGNGGRLRGIHRHEGGGLLEAIPAIPGG